MSDDFDSRYEFKDNQGHKFPVWAGSQAEAWNIAQRTIAAHDAAHQREQAQAEAEREARVERVQSVINTEYDRVRAKFDAQIAAGCDPRSGLRGVTHVPFEERDNKGRMGIDAAAAMQGNGAGEQMQPRQVGKQWTQAEYEAYQRKVAAGFDPYANLRSAAKPRQQESGWGCGEALLIVGAVVAIILFMMVMS